MPTTPSDEVIRQLQQIARYQRQEVCGLLDSEQDIYRIDNVANDKLRAFVFDRRQYFKALQAINGKGREVACVWHTHPTGDTTPSTTDLEVSKRLGYKLLIVTLNSYRWIDPHA